MTLPSRCLAPGPCRRQPRQPEAYRYRPGAFASRCWREHGPAGTRRREAVTARAGENGPEPDRLPPHRRRPDVPLQLAVRAPARRRVPAADREHRHGPRGRRVGRADPGVAALARDRLGRAGHLPARPDGRGAHLRRPAARRRARPTRTRARSASGCPTTGSSAGTTPCAAGSSSRTRTWPTW